MSWLFDRLCELASTDCVHVVVIADITQPQAGDDSIDVAEVLIRASQIPQTTVDVYAPVGVTPPMFDTADVVVDLDGVPPADRAEIINDHLRRVSACRVAHLRLRRDELAVTDHLPPDPLAPRTDALGAGDPRWRHVVVTDQPGHADLLARAAHRGLAISVDGVDPCANMHVSDILGVASILDALVTLRYFAFGLTCDLAATAD